VKGFLLTSAGVKNATIDAALVDLLGKPVAESSALCIPTATYALADGATHAWRLIAGQASTPLCVLELTALPSLDQATWLPMLEQTDALLVGGGDPLYLCHWMRQSGVAGRLGSLPDAVYVGVSAGSMVLAPQVGEEFVGWRPAGGGDRGLGVVDFAIFPHLDHEDLPDNGMATAETWAAGLSAPAYAIDDQTAIVIGDGEPEVISEGHWRRF
jgi:dipeptidase E